MTLRSLVVGLGQVGMGYDLNHNPEQFVMSHARAFQVHSAFKLVGGVDPDADQISLFESEYGCSGYSDLTCALKELNPDVIVIATPTVNHLQTLDTILSESNPKIIICEKPLAYDLNDATKMTESCGAAGIKLFVNYMRRVDTGVIEIKNRIDSGLISPDSKGVCWYSKGLFNNGSHFLNLLQYWLGDVLNFDVIEKGRLWDDIDPEPDVRVVFEKGTILFLAAKEEHYSHYTIEIISKNGRLEYRRGGAEILWQPIIDDPTYEGYQILSLTPEIIPSELDRVQIHILDHVAKSLNGHQSSICTADEALNTLKVLDEIGKVL